MDKVNESLEKLEDGIFSLQVGLKELKGVLVGNPEFRQPGLIDRITSVEQRMSQSEHYFESMATAKDKLMDKRFDEYDKKINKIKEENFKRKAVLGAAAGTAGAAAGWLGATGIQKFLSLFK